nr:ribonuclease H-like domain-containing protein [Tanacetum cinerariifolium]
KAFRIFNIRTRTMEENMHIMFSESTPNVVSSGPDWLFNIDALTRTMNYEPIVADNELPFDPNMHALEDVSIFDFSSIDEDDGAMADINNLDTRIQVSPIPTIRIHKDHPLNQVIGDLQSATQTRKMKSFYNSSYKKLEL